MPQSYPQTTILFLMDEKKEKAFFLTISFQQEDLILLPCPSKLYIRLTLKLSANDDLILNGVIKAKKKRFSWR